MEPITDLFSWQGWRSSGGGEMSLPLYSHEAAHVLAREESSEDLGRGGGLLRPLLASFLPGAADQ